jgi:D-beta-D-heptose 7-phosphate kinase/D-beta-D-heptose 1-phosphate adenosyltransferase
MPSRTISKNKAITVAVSGGFDPIHIGHIRMMREAKKLGHKLIVILNNDNWLIRKKGYVFMPQKERKEIIEALGCVDKVVLTKHSKNPKDMSVCQTLLEIKPDIFCNGGDRKNGNLDTAESKICQQINCKLILGIGRGGKVQSSSWLLKNFTKNMKS